MATVTVADGGEVAAHEIHLTASTVETVVFQGGLGKVTVINLDGTGTLYFTTDGTTPTVAGAHCYVMPAVIGALTVPVASNGPNTVKVISSGTPTVSVQRGT